DNILTKSSKIRFENSNAVPYDFSKQPYAIYCETDHNDTKHLLLSPDDISKPSPPDRYLAVEAMPLHGSPALLQ
ncbi:MAG: hypothetical protein ACQETR_15970, partial [Thermodesulfobacteriota bacterium]